MCPFCYIGKRNFEKALAQFPDSDKLEIVWKSFLLDPSVPDIATESYEDYLVKRKGLSAEQVRGMLKNVTQMASEAGLDYHFERAVMVSSQKAHQHGGSPSVSKRDVEKNPVSPFCKNGEFP